MKSEIIGNAIAVFGGNIGVVSVKYNSDENLYGLLLYNIDGEHKIGEEIENFSETIADKPNIELVFNNSESIDVVIDFLNNLKKNINNEK